ATTRERAGEVALRHRAGDSWAELTWADYADRVARAATALIELGLERGDRVVLMVRNRPEFHIADLAVVLAGGIPVSIYNSSSPEQVGWLAQHSGATLALADDAELLDRFVASRAA